MIYIVVRKTTDWSNEATVRAQLPPAIVPAVALWNATFRMPYHHFRHELKRIAQLTQSRVHGAEGVPRDAVPAGGIVVPTDDDDWFSPRLAQVLEAEADDHHVGYCWPSAFIEVPISLGHDLGLIRRTLFPRTPPKWLCTTNNYAVVMGSESAPLIDNHMHASRWFLAHPPRVKRLGERLSIMNRSLASTTSLWSNPSRAALLRKFRRYQKLYRKPVPAELSWCEPYVAMMRELMEHLGLGDDRASGPQV